MINESPNTSLSLNQCCRRYLKECYTEKRKINATMKI
jgi:hypothetical protein